MPTNNKFISTAGGYWVADEFGNNAIQVINQDGTLNGGTVIDDNSIANAKLATDIKVGSLASLTTTEKASVVGAINEVNAKPGGVWGSITGTLALQTDLQAALDAKENDYTGTLTSPIIKVADTIGSELLTNGGFETWAESLPAGWTITPYGASPGSIAEETTTVHTEGGSSLECVVGATDGTTIVSQTFTGLSTSSYLQIDTWAYKPSSNGATPNILLLNAATIETATKVYIPTSPETGAWTDIVGGDISPGALQLNEGDTEDAWVGVDDYTVPVPATGTVNVSFFGTGDEGENCFIDDLSVKTYTLAPNKDLFTFTDTTDVDNLTESDTVFKIDTTGGTGFTHLEMDGEGSFDTDYDDFDFSSKALRVGNSVDEKGALNAQVGMALLAVTPAVNLKTTGTTKFKNAGDITQDYNLPSGYHLFGGKLVTVVTEADTLSGDFEVSVGTTSPNYTEIFNTFAPGSTSIGQSSDDLSLYTGENGDVYLNLSKADAGTSGTAKFLLFGTLVSTDIA